MRRKVIMLLALLALAGTIWARGNHEPEPRELTPQILFDMVHEGVEYVSDLPGTNVVQSPEYTAQHRTGDCEDFCLLYLGLLYENFGYLGYVVYLERNDDPEKRHAMVWEHYNDVYQDPQTGKQYTPEDLATTWTVIGKYTYSEMLALADSPANLALLKQQEEARR
jgi:hypothetical protein